MAGLSLNAVGQPPANTFPPVANFGGANYLSQAPSASPQLGQTFTMHLWQ